MENGVKIGEQVKAARKLRGIKSAPVLAAELNKPRFGAAVIGQIERNERPAREHEVDWFAEFFDLPRDFFLTVPSGESQLDRIERRLIALSSIGDDVIARLDKLEKALGAHVDESAETVSQGVAGLANAFDQFVAAASDDPPPAPGDAAETDERPEADRRVRSRRQAGSGPR